MSSPETRGAELRRVLSSHCDVPSCLERKGSGQGRCRRRVVAWRCVLAPGQRLAYWGIPPYSRMNVEVDHDRGGGYGDPCIASSSLDTSSSFVCAVLLPFCFVFELGLIASAGRLCVHFPCFIPPFCLFFLFSFPVLRLRFRLLVCFAVVSRLRAFVSFSFSSARLE